MSEIKAAMLLMLFFVGILFPGILQFGIDAINQNAFTKNTKEYTELVQEEAGLTNKSKEVKERLESKGYQIKLTDQSGNTITGTVGYGNTIKIAYSYKYKSVFKHRTLKSSNVALVTKRDSKTVINSSKENSKEKGTRTISLSSNETKNKVQEQTFVVPQLGSIKGIKSNTGRVQIQHIEGDSIRLKMLDGEESRKVQTGGIYEKGAAKYVNNQIVANYKDSDGYTGILEKYVASGKLIMGQQKYISAHTSAYYKDNKGFEGQLTPYAYGEAYTEEKIKHIEDYQDSNTDNFPTQISYNQDGYTGFLNKFGTSKPIVASGSPANSIYIESLYGVAIQGFQESKIINEHWSNYSRIHEGEEYTGDLYLIPGTMRYDTKEINGQILYRPEAYYSGTISKPDTRKYKYRQYYKGDVMKPSTLDKNIYRYQGIVKQPDIDMREWRYQGTVRKPSIDTRTFDEYYKYTIEIIYEVKE